MSDKYAGGILAGSTSVSIDVLLRKKADNTELTGIAYNTSGNIASYRRGAVGARVAITLATQTATGAWSSGGFAEIDATNQPGLYRLDIPDAALATGVDYVTISIVTTSGYAYHERIALTTNVVQSGDNYPRLGAPAGASHAADIASVKTDTGTTIPGKLPTALAADGSMKASLTSILGTLLTEGVGGRLAAAFKQFFNIASPAATMDHGVLVDTATTLTNDPTGVGTLLTKVGTPAGVSVSADIAALKAVADAVKVITDQMVFTNAHQLDVGVISIAVDAVNASALATDAVTEIRNALKGYAVATKYGSFTFEQIWCVGFAILAAKTSGFAGATGTIRDIADSSDVLVTSIDADGNRGVPTITP